MPLGKHAKRQQGIIIGYSKIWCHWNTFGAFKMINNLARQTQS